LKYYEGGELFDSHGCAGSMVCEHLVEQTSDNFTIQRCLNHPQYESNYNNFQIDFLNLFIDLLWAGIVANILENFTAAIEAGNNLGLIFLEYPVLFLTTFKFGITLEDFSIPFSIRTTCNRCS
jgi:hypothetical protein